MNVRLYQVLSDEYLFRQKILYGDIGDVIAKFVESLQHIAGILRIGPDKDINIEGCPREAVDRKSGCPDDYKLNLMCV
jgi:hypothetical protein